MCSSQYRPFGHLKPLYTSLSFPYLLKRVTKHVLSFIMFCGPICDEIPLCACVLQFCVVCTIKYTNNAFFKGIGSMHSCLTGLHSIFNNFQLVGFFPSKFVMRMRSCQCCSFCDLSLKTSFHVIYTVMLSQKRLLVKF